jgi:hypothetical protein
MQEETSTQELEGRLALIESMIAEGRRTTESWGWTFVLWGVAYYVAIAWATWGRSTLAWPVTMIAAAILTGILASRIAVKNPETTVGRAMLAIWVGMGISLFILMFSLGVTGRLDTHVSVAIVGAMLGCANATSALILKWKMQFASALVWWVVAVVACLGTETQGSIGFLIAIFLCQIVFGIYGMIRESRKKALRGAAHA